MPSRAGAKVMVQERANLGGAGAGDAAAEHAHLWDVARRLTANDPDADDLAQEVWLEALERPPERFRHFRGWIGVVARRTAARTSRRDRCRRERERRAARTDEVPAAIDRCERADLGARVGALVDGLESPYREVVSLRYVDDLSIDEICQRLARPAGTVRCQLKRGLDRVRERVGARRPMLLESVA